MFTRAYRKKSAQTSRLRLPGLPLTPSHPLPTSLNQTLAHTRPRASWSLTVVSGCLGLAGLQVFTGPRRPTW